MAETSTKLGRVSLVPRGEYDPQAQYQRLDIVRYDGSSYLVLRDLQGVAPEDGSNYMLISEKGDKGSKGDAGDAAGFGAVGATVDDTSGTPSVDVASTGPDTAKEFSFSFHGLKGEQGTEGEKGDTGETGNGIASIERTSGTGAAGTADTYTIAMTDGSTSTFQVYNGADGTGAGDMLKSVYDPQNKNTDIFSYVDNAVSGVEIDVDADPTEGSPNPVSSGGTFSALDAKQPKLTGEPGRVVGFGADGAAVAVQGWSNPNLLDNWYFPDPINQRRQTEYVGVGYTIDRWYLYDSPSAKLLESGVQIKGKPTGAQFIQRFPLADIKEGTLLTLSFLDTDGELTICTGNAALNVDSGFFVNTSWGWIAFRKLSSASFWEAVYYTTADKILVAAKLEPGSIQTLAHQDADGNWVLNDPPPNKALELAKCQRYARAIKAITGGARYGQGFAVTSTSAFIIVEFGVYLRITPSVIAQGTFWLVSAGNPVAVTNISFGAYADGIVTLRCDTDEGLTPGALYQLMDNNTATSSIFFDANL